MVHEIPHSLGRLTKSHVYALNNGAVITQGLNATQSDLDNLKFKPGDIVELATEDDQVHTFSCRILDIELVRTDAGHVIIRLTLRKS
jgi:hypothetical protein